MNSHRETGWDKFRSAQTRAHSSGDWMFLLAASWIFHTIGVLLIVAACISLLAGHKPDTLLVGIALLWGAFIHFVIAQVLRLLRHLSMESEQNALLLMDVLDAVLAKNSDKPPRELQGLI